MNQWQFDSNKNILFAILIAFVFHIILFFSINYFYKQRMVKLPSFTEITIIGIKTKSKFVPETITKRSYRFTAQGIISRNIPEKKIHKLKSEIKIPSFARTYQPKFSPRNIKSVGHKMNLFHSKRIVYKHLTPSKIFTPQFTQPMKFIDRFQKKMTGTIGKKISVGTKTGKNISSNIIWLTGDKLNRRLLYKPPVSYPKSALRKSITGNVKLQFKVNPSGSVFDIVPLIKSNSILTNYAMFSLREYKFEPLPTSVGNVIQEGSILFVFQLTSRY